MKRKTIIIGLVVSWLCCLICAYFAINRYIDNKRSELRSDLWEKLSNLFEGQDSNDNNIFVDNSDGFFDEVFSNKPVRNYKKIAIPPKPKGEYAKLRNGQLIEEWENDYGDLNSLYELNWGGSYPNEENEGWNIVRIHFSGLEDEIIQTNIIFPYKVGFKKNNWGISYTVEEAVDEAFEFYTTDEKSNYSDRYKKGSNNQLWSKIYDCSNNNRYYGIVKNEGYNGGILGTPIIKPDFNAENFDYDAYRKEQLTLPYENGYMYNGYYKVFIAATQETHYMIKEKAWAVEDDRNKLFLWWGVGLTLIFFAFIIPLTIIEKKTIRLKEETTYQRLIRLCNPKEFLKDYNKEKVDKANELYQRLINTSPTDTEILVEIQTIAINELGITLLDKKEIEDLKDIVNPKRFLNPYNAEKLSKANELYAALSKEGLTYNEFMSIKEQSKEL